MSPELTLLLTLALRMAITAAFVVTASVITERSGPVIGALIATLPISAGPSYVFLALDHDAAFIAEGALASLPINAATIFLGLTYVVLAQRQSASVSCLTAVAVWILLASFIRSMQWIAHRRPNRECGCFRDLRAVAEAFSQRQDAADHAPLVRHSPARIAGRDAGGPCGHAIGLGWSPDQRHHRAVPGGVHVHDADPASAHRRAPDRGRAREQRRRIDGAGHRDCRLACRSTPVRFRGWPQSGADGLRQLESWPVVERAKKTRAVNPSLRGAKRRSNPLFVLPSREMDCVASLAMTIFA